MRTVEVWSVHLCYVTAGISLHLEPETTIPARADELLVYATRHLLPDQVAYGYRSEAGVEMDFDHNLTLYLL